MSETDSREVTRRAVLGGLVGIGAVTLLRLLPADWLRALSGDSRRPAPHAILVRNNWPEHWETSVDQLGRSRITPNDLFFVRTHLPVPTLDAATHRMEVTGLVSKPLTLDLAALHAMPATNVTATLECAGNGRGLMKLKNTSGTQWGYGAVGTAKWTGVALREVLTRAGVAPDAAHVWFEAADHGPFSQTPRFVRSIPLALALDRALLAFAMNDVELPVRHGGPVRVIVPGWYGMASTKWVTKIRVEATPSDNHFMVNGYRYVAPGGDPRTSPPVDVMRVKSLITHPLDGQHCDPGTLEVRGIAWSGAGPVMRVDVSGDGGRTWHEARLEGSAPPPNETYAWRRWTVRLSNVRGNTHLLARATDASGATQPLVPEVNTGGYGNNAAHLVTVIADA